MSICSNSDLKGTVHYVNNITQFWLLHVLSSLIVVKPDVIQSSTPCNNCSNQNVTLLQYKKALDQDAIHID